MFFQLKTEMDKNGISIEAMAQTIGKSPDWLEEALTGKIEMPTEVAALIKEKFFPGATFDYLFYED